MQADMNIPKQQLTISGITTATITNSKMTSFPIDWECLDTDENFAEYSS